MKNKTLIIVLISCLGFLAVSILIFMISLLSGKSNFRFLNSSYNVSNKLVFDEVYENNFSSINIESKASDISLKNSSDNMVRVVIYGDKDSTKVSDGDILDIKSDGKKCIGICFNNKISKIEVYVPSSYSQKINIKNNFGDINVGSFIGAFVSILEDCGDVFVDKVNRVKVSNAYGDIKVNEALSADIDQSAGDVEVGYVNNISVQNKYGDIDIKKVSGYLNIKEECGDINISTLELNRDSVIKNGYGDVEIGKTNEIYIDAKTDLGDVDINNNYNKSDISLIIKNNLGDIEVNN